MTVQTGAQVTILPGATVQLPPPNAGGIGLGALVLDNLSTFLLLVTIGPDTFYQAPLTENAYDYSNASQPAQVTALRLPGDIATSGTLAPAWYDSGSLPAQGKWPVALSGPASVAAATAAALLNSGVPPVIIQARLASSDPIAAGDFKTYDVSKYTSVQVGISRSNTGTAQVGYAVNAGGLLLSTMGRWNKPAQTSDNVAWWFPTTDATLTISNPMAATVFVDVLASNRAVPGLIGGQGQPDIPREFFLPSQAVVGANDYYVPPNDPNTAAGVDYTQGPGLFGVQAVCTLAGSVGYWYAEQDGTVNRVFLSDGAGAGVPANTRVTYYNVPLPAAAIHWFFHPTASGTSSATIQVWPS
jgi:hypothetical protein